eukprot:c45750_g1_i1 orf=3-152(-)
MVVHDVMCRDHAPLDLSSAHQCPPFGSMGVESSRFHEINPLMHSFDQYIL